MQANDFMSEYLSELLTKLSDVIKQEPIRASDVLRMVADSLGTYEKAAKTHMNLLSTYAVESLVALLDEKYKGDPNYNSWYAPAVFIMNPTGYRQGNTSAVCDMTDAFCETYLKSGQRKDWENTLGIDLDPVLQDYMKLQEDKKAKNAKSNPK